MGTVTPRPRKDGSTGYLAQISIMREGAIVFRQSKTFDRAPAANAWIKKREAELAKPGALTRAEPAKSAPTLAHAIDRYNEESLRKAGKTKTQVLNKIKTHDIAAMRCGDITSLDIVAFAKEIGRTAKPQTTANYIAHLGSVFGVAKAAWRYDLDPQAMKDAVTVAKKLGLIGKSKSRSRRPTLEELDALLTHFATVRTRRPTSAPMVKIVAFAIFSTRRQEEITRLRWADLESAGDRILVRNMKNPGDKGGNDVLCDVPPEALRIIRSMPKVAEEIFPYKPGTIGDAFTRAVSDQSAL